MERTKCKRFQWALLKSQSMAINVFLPLFFIFTEVIGPTRVCKETQNTEMFLLRFCFGFTLFTILNEILSFQTLDWTLGGMLVAINCLKGDGSATTFIVFKTEAQLTTVLAIMGGESHIMWGCLFQDLWIHKYPWDINRWIITSY